MHHAQLRAISRPAYDLLLGTLTSEESLEARMLARFRRALNLIVGDTVIALVIPELGNGPFHLVVDHLPPPLTGGLHPIWWEAETLHIGPWVLHYTQTIRIWEPQPDWSQIRIGTRQRQRFHDAVESVTRAKMVTLTGSAGAIASQLTGSVEPLAEAVVSLDLPGVCSAAGTLCGLGPGLTPSGDDYLAGALLALWAGHHPHRYELCSAIREGTAGRTTTLSQAFIAAAARGEANERWQTLLSFLGAQPAESRELTQQIERAVSSISTYGATSGMDMLAGFEAGLIWCTTAPQ